jgi:hypothetical protein
MFAGAALILSICGTTRGLAQTLPGPAWSVVASGGGSASVAYKGYGWSVRFDSAVISYTVGETCINFDHETKFDITEGFQQPDGYGIKPYSIFDAIEQLIFYPNPCRQFSFVRFYLNESFTHVTLKVYAIDGRQCYADDFQCGDGKVTYQLPTNNLAPGMYVVEVIGYTGKRYVGKLVIIP